MTWSGLPILVFSLILSTCVTTPDPDSAPNAGTDPDIVSDDTVPTNASSLWEDCENASAIAFPNHVSIGLRLGPSEVGRIYSIPRPARSQATIARHQTHHATGMHALTVSGSPSRDNSNGKRREQPQVNAYKNSTSAGNGEASGTQSSSSPSGSYARLATNQQDVTDVRIQVPDAPIGPITGIGGTPAPAYPWAAHINIITTTDGVSENISKFCGATLVSESWLMTAAHCVSAAHLQKQENKNRLPETPEIELDIVDIEVKLGNVDLYPNDTTLISTHRVTQAKCHSSFDGVSFDNDIALLKLDGTVDVSRAKGSSPYIRVGALPSQSEDELNAQEVSSVGWGLTDYDSTIQYASPVLIETKMKVDPDTVETFGEQFSSNPGAIVTARHACTGDSGGSVALINLSDAEASVIVGINSNITGNLAQEGCSETGVKTWFTRVANYRTVIDEIISQ